MSVLNGTSLDFLLTVFQVKTDKDLIDRMTWIGLAYTVVVGLYSALKPAPYGRYSSSSWGPTVPAKLGWMFQESPVVIGVVALRFLTPSAYVSNPGNFLPLTLIVAHYVNRTFIYTWKMSRDAKPCPLVTVLSAWVFCAYNGILQAHHLLNVTKVTDLTFVAIGSVIFVLGMAINIHHDDLLRELRKEPSKGANREYKIPHGGLFDYISGANFFGEIVEWWGLALITRQYPQIVFALFSMVFLGLRAYHHHRWYLSTFKSYPKSRKAVIPFIF